MVLSGKIEWCTIDSSWWGYIFGQNNSCHTGKLKVKY